MKEVEKEIRERMKPNSMDTLQEYAFLIACGIGVIIGSPIIGICLLIKLIYELTPSKIRKRQNINKRREDRKQEIREWETSLNFRPDPYYINKIDYRSQRNEFLKAMYLDKLKNYKAPDMIMAIKKEYNTCCNFILLLHKDYYNMPPETPKADTYFTSFYHPPCTYLMDPAIALPSPGDLVTLTECGQYENYYAVEVPRESQQHEMMSSNIEKIFEFIVDVKKKYRKPIANEERNTQPD